MTATHSNVSAEVTTTDATITQILSQPLRDNSTTRAHIVVVGRDSAGNSKSFYSSGLMKRQSGGVATLVDSILSVLAPSGDVAAATGLLL